MSQWKKHAKYRDVADLPEDERIRLIGEAAMRGEVTAFVTDDEPGKPERYIKKLKQRFPQIKIIGHAKGPVANCVTVRLIVEQARN